MLSTSKTPYWLGQQLEIPPEFNNSEWWDDEFKSFMLSYLNRAQDDSNVAHLASAPLNCMSMLVRERLDTSKHGKRMAVTLAEAFERLCKPKQKSRRGPLKEHNVWIKTYQVWKAKFFLGMCTT